MLCIGVAALLLGTAAITGNTNTVPAETAMALARTLPPNAATAQPYAPPLPVDTAQQADAQVSEIEAKLASTQRQHATVSAHAEALTAARAELKTRMTRYRVAAIARLSAQLKETEALHNIYKARLTQSGEALDRQQQLKAKGYASQANYDAATASAAVARNDVAASAARIERIRVELDAARKGVFISDGRDDVPYSQQRDDEIMLRLVELKARATALQATVEDLQAQIAAETGIVAAGDTVDSTADVADLVWNAVSPRGMPARPGDPRAKPSD